MNGFFKDLNCKENDCNFKENIALSKKNSYLKEKHCNSKENIVIQKNRFKFQRKNIGIAISNLAPCNL